MKVWKRGVVVGIFVVVIVLLFVFEGNITGNVVWEPTTVVDDCSDGDINDLWNEVFEESSSGITIFKETPAAGDDCTRFGAVKGDGVDEIWNLYYSLSDSGNIVVDYANVTTGLYSDIMALSDVDDLSGVRAMLVSRLDEVNNYSMEDAVAALVFFRSKFKLTSDAMAYDSGAPPLYFSVEFSSSGNWEYNITYSVFENKSFAGVLNRIEPIASLIGDIPDFEFDKNSSWNDAFDVSDYFDVAGGIVVNFSSVGSNNTNGEWINYSILGGGVSFKPAVNFTGYRIFKLVANVPGGDDVFSNAFNVSIVVPNEAPVLKRVFDAIPVPRDGGARVVLGVYFEDPDGDDMTYRATGDSDLDVTFSGGLMTIRLEDGFNDTTRFRVYASDGIEETGSNNIYVYEEGDSAAAALAEDLAGNESDDDDNETVENDTSSGDAGNESGASASDDGEGMSRKTLIFLVIGVIIGLVLVLFVIWFFLLKNKGAVRGGQSGVVPNPFMAPQNPVNSYLRGLNLSKR